MSVEIVLYNRDGGEVRRVTMPEPIPEFLLPVANNVNIGQTSMFEGYEFKVRKFRRVGELPPTADQYVQTFLTGRLFERAWFYVEVD